MFLTTSIDINYIYKAKILQKKGWRKVTDCNIQAFIF